MISNILETLLRAAVCVATVIVLTRINGLRSFSKMSSFDFAITVAYGSVIASAVIFPKKSIVCAMAALASLFALQAILDWIKARYSIA